jgi:hypothetical protein
MPGMRFARALIVAACIAAGLSAAVGVEAQPRAEAEPKACAPTVSLDKRLVMEQWARDEACAQPLRTRVTDRFLGIACLETSPDASACRAFTPPPGSRAFNTSRVFRCVDIALADTEQGIVVSRLMEWAAPAPKVCDWTAAREALVMEVDFVRGDVCVGGLCMPVDRLSTIGKLRLRELIESALRELGLLASTSSVRAGSVARN